TDRQLIPDLQVLKLGQNAIRAVHIEAEQVLEPVVRVGAAPPAAHLDQPWPDGVRRRIDLDSARGEDVRAVEQLVAGKLRARVLLADAPGQASAPPEPRV